MFELAKRVVGELVVLLVAVNLAYLLLSFLYNLQWESRVAVVSLLLAGVAVAMIRLK